MPAQTRAARRAELAQGRRNLGPQGTVIIDKPSATGRGTHRIWVRDENLHVPHTIPEDDSIEPSSTVTTAATFTAEDTALSSTEPENIGRRPRALGRFRTPSLNIIHHPKTPGAPERKHIHRDVEAQVEPPPQFSLGENDGSPESPAGKWSRVPLQRQNTIIVGDPGYDHLKSPFKALPTQPGLLESPTTPVRTICAKKEFVQSEGGTVVINDDGSPKIKDGDGMATKITPLKNDNAFATSGRRGRALRRY